MKVTLPNGLTLEGTVEQVSDASRKMGYSNIIDERLYYYSESKGEFIRIPNMDTKYLANALYKMWRGFPVPMNGKEFSEQLCIPNFFALLKEYEKRSDR